ncbi:peptidoglycan-binding protein LysM [Dyadobacter sp. OTU695]|uniref:peptidoglycan-binding protein LysM n=1 Tax=Dyadobacter sp. OTU695 TaxID=3043860 RepID=UPI00313C8446
MGLLSFIKGVGEKIFQKDEAGTASHPAEVAEPLRASALLAYIKSLGLPYNNLSVKTSQHAVILEGNVAWQEDAEKIALAVGNVEDVDLVDNRIEVVAPTAAARFHTVERGDTFSKIAQTYYYGNMTQYPVIFEANKPMLKNPDLIYPGQTLRIPAL